MPVSRSLDLDVCQTLLDFDATQAVHLLCGQACFAGHPCQTIIISARPLTATTGRLWATSFIARMYPVSGQEYLLAVPYLVVSNC